MIVRRATPADEGLLRAFWEEFVQEVPFAIEEPETWEEEWADILEDLEGGAVLVAEDDEGPVGVVRLQAPVRGRAHLQFVHVRPRGRRCGIAKALLRECVADARTRGAQFISLEALSSNPTALAVWHRLGFEDAWVGMATPLDRLGARLAPRDDGQHRATTHVQSDDEVSVGRAVAQFMPRLAAAEISTNGSWIRVTDPVLDGDRDAHGRLAGELSERLGAVTVALSLEGRVVRFRLYERGRMVDEYLSVPNYYGVLSKGDELALAANPTLVARLTGADPDEVRRIARNAEQPEDLAPAPELYERLGHLMGLDA